MQVFQDDFTIVQFKHFRIKYLDPLFFQYSAFRIWRIVVLLSMCHVMHQSVVTPAPSRPPRDGRGRAGLMCGAVTFWVPPQCRVSAGLVTLRKYTPVEFTIIKSRAMTLSRFPQCRAFSRAVMDEKSLSPLFPVGGRGGGRWGRGSGYKMTSAQRRQRYVQCG